MTNGTLPAQLLGPDAPALPRIGFGGMPLSITGRPTDDVAINVLNASLEAGVRLLDTADVYCHDHRDIGHNEKLIATAVEGWSGDRDSIVIATKGGMIRPDGHWERDARPASLIAACDRSLKALKTEIIDLYQLHAPDPTVPFADSVGALADLQREGKVRWVGLSNVSVAQIQEAQRIVTVVTVQNRLNPFFREALDTGVVQYCDAEGIGFLAYSPVGGGRLNRKLPHEPVLQRVAQARGATTHEVVLAWVLSKGRSVFIIPGARTEEHALSSVRAATLELTDDDIRDIDSTTFSRA